MQYSDWYFRICVSTSYFSITFPKGSGLELVAFADAKYANKATDRTSVSVRAAMCVSTWVCFLSRTQKCFILSTTEAAYAALAYTIEGVMSIRHVWMFIFAGFGATCMTFFEDSEGPRHRHKIQCARRTRSTSTCETILRELTVRGEFIFPYVRVGGAACRLPDKVTQQCGFWLPPGLSDEI